MLRCKLTSESDSLTSTILSTSTILTIVFPWTVENTEKTKASLQTFPTSKSHQPGWQNQDRFAEINCDQAVKPDLCSRIWKWAAIPGTGQWNPQIAESEQSTESSKTPKLQYQTMAAISLKSAIVCDNLHYVLPASSLYHSPTTWYHWYIDIIKSKYHRCHQ